MRVVKEKANAKINLYLDVISKRADGFHDIKTVMHSLSLSDAVTVSYVPSQSADIKLFVSGNRHIPTDSKNLAYKAARLYLSAAGDNAAITISLHKRIPIAAGLAGGSSDAAAVLRAMNKIFNKKFSERALYGLAAELGSDVPYCLYGKTALCEGRGEKLTKLPDSLKLHTVIAIASEHVSTPEAYSALDNIFNDFDGSVKNVGEEKFSHIIKSVQSGVLNTDGLYNIFETAVFGKCRSVELIKKKMLELGATSSLMSGSGPSVFGIFKNREDAENACTVLRSMKFTAHYAESV